MSLEAAELEKALLDMLQAEDMAVLARFLEFQESDIPFYDKIEFTHEFLDAISLKIRESKCRMDKEELARFQLAFFRKTLKDYGYNPRFVASQCKTLVTFHRNRKNLAGAIEVLEFLIFNGITDDEAQGFHVQLDELYRLRTKRESRSGPPP